MRGGKIIHSGGKLLLTGMAISLCVMGSCYAMWTDSLQVRTKMVTALFDLVFSEGKSCQTALTDAAGEVQEEAEAEWQIGEDGKTAEISFPNGIPAAFLSNEHYLKISYTMEPSGEHGLWGAAETEAELECPAEIIEMEPEQVTLLWNGTGYGAEELCEEFAVPLECYVSGETERDGEYLQGAVYLWLTDRSVQRLEQLPEVLEVTEEELAGLCETDHEWEVPEISGGKEQIVSSDSGIVVLYSCRVPLYFDQAQSEEYEEEGSVLDAVLGKISGKMTAYAYWVDRAELYCDIPLVHAAEIIVEEESAAADAENKVTGDNTEK